MLLFDPNCKVPFPDSLGSSVEKLIQILTELVVDSVIRPRLSAGGAKKRVISRGDLIDLLDHAATCTSPEALSKNLRSCPTTNSLIHFDGNANAQEGEGCPCCEHLLVTKVKGDFIQHLVEPDPIAVKSLFQDHLKFLFFFEQIAELFVHHRRDHPNDIRDFLNHLLASSTRLHVSWRFLTVIIKSILSTQAGSITVDSILSTIICNAPTKDLNSNTQNFLRALLVRADEDARSIAEGDRQPLRPEDWSQAIMSKEWTLQRIHRLGLVREVLSSGGIDVAVNALTEWARLRRIERDEAATEAFLFFILNFASAKGDETRLGAIFSQLRAVGDFSNHPIVGPYIKILSPLSLGFNVLPVGMRTHRFEELMMNGLPFNDIFHYYPLLQVFHFN